MNSENPFLLETDPDKWDINQCFKDRERERENPLVPFRDFDEIFEETFGSNGS
jgi:hypothetical protein